MYNYDLVSEHSKETNIRKTLWFCILIVFIFIIWASIAEIDEVTRGEGRVVPSTKVQLIQSLEGGIIKNILVKEGDIVSRGQVLVELEDIRFKSEFLETKSRVSSLTASIARLEAEVKNQSVLTFPNSIEISPEDMISEKSLFKARRDKKNQKINSLEMRLELVKEELAIILPLVSSSSISMMEEIRLKKEIENIKSDIIETENSYMENSYTELTKKSYELNGLKEILEQKKDQLKRTKITSSVKGTINNLLVNTKGGVVQSGEPIMEVLPIEEQLLIEAKVKPKDIAFLAPGMTAKVKLTAYDYTIYGDIGGVIKQISADTIKEETAKGTEYFYQVQVVTNKSHLEKEGKVLPIRPGMVAQVDILGNKRTILSYLLKPIVKAKLN